MSRLRSGSSTATCSCSKAAVGSGALAGAQAPRSAEPLVRPYERADGLLLDLVEMTREREEDSGCRQRVAQSVVGGCRGLAEHGRQPLKRQPGGARVSLL